ncbi:hypothetical protein ACFWXO_18620 [Kitasatospora sp. NPDC059088]|uniref:hypothetical protein n=1 Tax=Kitasatospora sp. NPDC059088 TaxID=3346722 RepID=UPI003689D057
MLETDRTSWTAILDAVRPEPGADHVATTIQLHGTVATLITSGPWKRRDTPEIRVAMDVRYDVPRTASPLADLSSQILGRIRSTIRTTGSRPETWLSASRTGEILPARPVPTP